MMVDMFSVDMISMMVSMLTMASFVARLVGIGVDARSFMGMVRL